MFTARPQGSTLRRDLEALHRPHPASERFDPDFPIVMRCSLCGKSCYGPRKHMQASMREHWESHCPARARKADEVKSALILAPRC